VSGLLEFTILGSGSSGGVPRADGSWGACDPDNPKNRRSRCSLLVRRKARQGQTAETTVLVDTSPDLRLQTAAAGVDHVDAVLYTHDHADQTHGIDDLRAFYVRHRRRTPCYMDAHTERQLLHRFDYIFQQQGGYPAICDAHRLPAHGVEWLIEGPSGAVPVLGYDQDHGEIRSVGFRFGPVAYSSDAVGLPEDAFAALAGVEVFIVDALRYTSHPTHANVETALSWIERVKPKRAILTNLHVDLDYDELAARLPDGVEPAFDGMRFELPF